MSRMRGKAQPRDSNSAAVVVGIDVSKAWLDVFLHPDGERFRVENDAAGLRRLRTRCLAISAELVVMEATGRYHRAAHACLHAAGVRVAIIKPYRSRRFADVLGRLAKTDQIDAEVLARFAAVMEPAPTEPPSDAMARITEITPGPATAGSGASRLGEPAIADVARFGQGSDRRADRALQASMQGSRD